MVVTLRGWWEDLEFDASFGVIVAQPGTTIPVPDVVGLGDQGSSKALGDAGFRFNAIFQRRAGRRVESDVERPSGGDAGSARLHRDGDRCKSGDPSTRRRG